MTERVEVDGLAVGFRRAGRGPALVLVHGALGDSRVWRAQLEDLSDEFTVVAWDAPGCGGSDDPPAAFRLEDYADCLAGFVRTLGLDRPHVLGHSFGGGLALLLGARYPALPRSLVVAGGYAGWAGSLPAAEVDARLRLALRLADSLPRPLTPDALPGLLSGPVARERREELAAIMSDARAVGTRVMAKAFAAADLRDVVPLIEVPTLLLYGDDDERAPRHVAEALHAAIATSSLVTAPGHGHEWYFAAPLGFDAEVRRFLRSLG